MKELSTFSESFSSSTIPSPAAPSTAKNLIKDYVNSNNNNNTVAVVGGSNSNLLHPSLSTSKKLIVLKRPNLPRGYSPACSSAVNFSSANSTVSARSCHSSASSQQTTSVEASIKQIEDIRSDSSQKPRDRRNKTSAAAGNSTPGSSDSDSRPTDTAQCENEYDAEFDNDFVDGPSRTLVDGTIATSGANCYATNGTQISTAAPSLTLEEREVQYEEARKRIFGSSAGTDAICSSSTPDLPNSSSSPSLSTSPSLSECPTKIPMRPRQYPPHRPQPRPMIPSNILSNGHRYPSMNTVGLVAGGGGHMINGHLPRPPPGFVTEYLISNNPTNLPPMPPSSSSSSSSNHRLNHTSTSSSSTSTSDYSNVTHHHNHQHQYDISNNNNNNNNNIINVEMNIRHNDKPFYFSHPMSGGFYPPLYSIPSPPPLPMPHSTRARGGQPSYLQYSPMNMNNCVKNVDMLYGGAGVNNNNNNININNECNSVSHNNFLKYDNNNTNNNNDQPPSSNNQIDVPSSTNPMSASRRIESDTIPPPPPPEGKYVSSQLSSDMMIQQQPQQQNGSSILIPPSLLGQDSNGGGFNYSSGDGGGLNNYNSNNNSDNNNSHNNPNFVTYPESASSLDLSSDGAPVYMHANINCQYLKSNYISETMFLTSGAGVGKEEHQQTCSVQVEEEEKEGGGNAVGNIKGGGSFICSVGTHNQKRSQGRVGDGVSNNKKCSVVSDPKSNVVKESIINSYNVNSSNNSNRIIRSGKGEIRNPQVDRQDPDFDRNIQNFVSRFDKKGLSKVSPLNSVYEATKTYDSDFPPLQ